MDPHGTFSFNGDKMTVIHEHLVNCDDVTLFQEVYKSDN
jgi:hypothetical protein